MEYQDMPEAREALFTQIISFYREMHNRAKGKPCKCGVCRMVDKLVVERLGIDLTLDPERFRGADKETFFRGLEVAGDDDFDSLSDEEMVARVYGRRTM